MKKIKIQQLIILSFFIVSSGYLIMVAASNPYLGIDLEENAQGYTVAGLNKDGWAAQNNIPFPARLISVEGQSPDKHFTVAMFNELEMADSFTIERAGKTISYQNIESSSPLHWALYIILPSVFFLAILAISYLVHQRVPRRFSAHQLILYFLTIATGYISNSGAIRDDLYGIFLNTALFLIAPVILIHFLYNYFKELSVSWFSKSLYYVLYFISIFVSVLESYFLITHTYPDYFNPVPGWLLLGLYIILFYVVYRGLYIHFSNENGTVFKYMSVGMTVAFFPYIVLYLLPALIIHKKIIPLEVAAVFLIALPITFMYLITRERLIDINFVMSRLRYYFFLSIVPSVIITVLFTLFAPYSLSIITCLQIYLIVHLLLIAFLSVKEVLDFKLQRFLFAARYSYQESMHRISKNMKDQSNAVDLMKALRDEIRNVLDVKDIYIYSKHNKRNMYCVYDRIPNHILDHLEEQIDPYSFDIGTIVETEEGFGVVVGFSLEKLTMLWCRGKKDFTNLNRDEKTYLQTISHNANIAIENMNLIEDLVKELKRLRNDQTQKYPTWLSRLLFTIAENQRKQLSIDLHDTVLQEQLYLYRRMDELINRHQSLSEPIISELMIYKESLLDSIHLIRETCNELRPAFIEELGLVQSLKNLIQQYQLRSNFTVYFTNMNFDADLDQERILAIYRVVQELLANAMKHSNAKIVNLSLSNDENNVQLVYSDNGIGMDLSFHRDIFSHIGLSGIEQRVNGLNGNLKINTAPGDGFTMTIEFPYSVSKEVEV
ncbi:ATP-binding protein [Halobacillus salinarum]|uniref:ATP-binding protein n=1 Tax=Halobacillus salinarum TaxID=2932257 RepID=A0ABY4ERD7_9BACI|nr:ATP-binding protein [Halobacillus salinarum]UOQ46214.1 ATP-binding protein [Halobacillus salinarum]